MRKVTDQNLTNLASYEVLDYLEGIGLQHLLERFEGNQSQLAQAIGMNRATLRKRLVKHALHEVHAYVRKPIPVSKPARRFRAGVDLTLTDFPTRRT